MLIFHNPRSHHDRKDYNALQEIIKNESIDVVLCDHVSFGCQQVVKDSKLPLIITLVINDADGTHFYDRESVAILT